MRSTAGIVAGLLVVGLFANCGGSDSEGTGAKGGSANVSGEGGDGPSNTGATSSGGTSSTAGKASGTAGDAGTPAVEPTGCTKDADCGATGKCVATVCKKNDGQTCATSAECQNACIDKVCTDKLADGKDCTVDNECAHTCIDSVCAPASDVGGDCDVDLGAGGAGGAGSVSSGGAGGAGPDAPQARDCAAPLQCFAGKCLTPNGESCKDNVDCVNSCVKSVCQPKQGLDGTCDDQADCISTAFVCDATAKKCKLDLKQQCNDNGQCQSDRCLCSNSDCSVRTCKTPTSVCLCRWSPADSPSCDINSAALLKNKSDPNGCGDSAHKCDGAGLCIGNTAGDCEQKCKIASNGGDNLPGTADDICTSFLTASGCNSGYHGQISANGDCKAVKTGTTFTDKNGTHYDAVCQAACTCEQN